MQHAFSAASAAGPTGSLQTLSPRLDAVGVDGGGREVAQRDGGVLDLWHARHPQQAKCRRQMPKIQVCDTQSDINVMSYQVLVRWEG
jgi:hypothetical protein